jgi:hypothetical protein
MAATVSGASDPMANKTPASKGYRRRSKRCAIVYISRANEAE